MRSLLLFIGSLLYPTVMVIISPLLALLYMLFGAVLLSNFLQRKTLWLLSMASNLRLHSFHLLYKKQLAFRPKAVRLH